MNNEFKKSELEMLFSEKVTENGDKAFNTTGNVLIDILFMSEYYGKHLNEVPFIGDSYIAKVFAMFIRDPRFGLGRRDLGRILMGMAELSPEEIVKCGRYDDLFLTPVFVNGEEVEGAMSTPNLGFLFSECQKGNELAKKWMPRYSSKHLLIARMFASLLGLNKQQYGKLIKANTVENQMSRQEWEGINFEHVPSLAAIKYARAFQKHQPQRYNQYLNDVRSGKKELHVATTNVYDIYRNRTKIDADLFYSKLDKITISCIPIIDVSGSMWSDDALGKALSIGKYLSDCSSYCNGQFVTFSSRPQLVTQKGNSYLEIFNNMMTSDWGMNTDLGRVMNLLQGLNDEFPEYLIILSDMEFDDGSSWSKDALMRDWKARGINTKIIWWNFNSRNTTCPETDEYGNIFISGYNPTLLKYLEAGFNAEMFLQKLLQEYVKNINL